MFCVFMILRERARKVYYQIDMVMIMVVDHGGNNRLQELRSRVPGTSWFVFKNT